MDVMSLCPKHCVYKIPFRYWVLRLTVKRSRVWPVKQLQRILDLHNSLFTSWCLKASCSAFVEVCVQAAQDGGVQMVNVFCFSAFFHFWIVVYELSCRGYLQLLVDFATQRLAWNSQSQQTIINLFGFFHAFCPNLIIWY